MKPVFISSNKDQTTEIIKDRVFCITGTLSHERKYFAEYITSQGGEVINRINDSVDCLIAGEDAVQGTGTAKVCKAEELHIPIISEEQFLQITETHIALIDDATPTPPRQKKIKQEATEDAPAYISTAACPLNGKTFCITGTLSKGRKQFESFIKKNGGKFIRDMSSTVQFLIAGSDVMGTAKLQRARDMGTQVLTETDFLQMAGVNSVMI